MTDPRITHEQKRDQLRRLHSPKPVEAITTIDPDWSQHSNAQIGASLAALTPLITPDRNMALIAEAAARLQANPVDAGVVERVALAICNDDRRAIGWSEISSLDQEIDRDDYLSNARAALTAAGIATVKGDGATASYDEIADVLYVSLFNPPRAAVGDEVTISVVLRRDGETNELVGLTIIDLKGQAALDPPAATLKDRADQLAGAARAMDKAVRTARDLVPDDDEGLASEIFARHINIAQHHLCQALSAWEARPHE